MPLKAAAFCCTRVILRGPRKKRRVSLSESAFFPQLEARHSNGRRKIEKGHQIERVFKFFAPTDQRARYDSTRTAAQIFQQCRAALIFVVFSL